MTKEEFYELFEQICGIKGDDNLNFVDEDNFNSVACISMMSELESRGAALDIMDIMECATLIEFYNLVKAEIEQ